MVILFAAKSNQTLQSQALKIYFSLKKPMEDFGLKPYFLTQKATKVLLVYTDLEIFPHFDICFTL